MFVSSFTAARRAALAVTVMSGMIAAAPAFAQDAPQPPAQTGQESFTPEQLRLAQQVVEATRSGSSFDDILPTVAEQTKGLFIRQNPAISQEIEDVTNAVAIKLAARRVELDRTVQEVWARRFSVDEMRQIIAFYQTPAGTKLSELGPDILALSVGAARQWGEQISSDMVDQVRAELKSRGYDL
jgi:hypothetical protein